MVVQFKCSSLDMDLILSFNKIHFFFYINMMIFSIVFAPEKITVRIIMLALVIHSALECNSDCSTALFIYSGDQN